MNYFWFLTVSSFIHYKKRAYALATSTYSQLIWFNIFYNWYNIGWYFINIILMYANGNIGEVIPSFIYDSINSNYAIIKLM